MYAKNLILLLRSLTLNYPIIHDWGYSLKKPIALVFMDVRQMMKFCKELCPNPEFINNSMDMKYIKKILNETCSNGIFYEYSPPLGYKSKKYTEIMDAIFSTARHGGMMNSVIFIVFEKYVPDELKNSVIEIIVTDGTISEPMLDLIPASEDLNIIKYNLSSANKNLLNPFGAAAMFMQPKLSASYREELLADLQAIAVHVVKYAEDAKSEDSMAEFVIQLITDYYYDGNAEICSISSAKDMEDEDIEKTFFMYKNRLYMSEKLFRNIVKAITAKMSVTVLKRKLQSEGLIIGRPGEYTTKVKLIRQDEFSYLRLMQFDLDMMPEMCNRIRIMGGLR